MASDLSSSNSPVNPSLASVTRKFWWPAYGDLRDGGLTPKAAAILVSRLFCRLAGGSLSRRHADYDDRLRLLVQGELDAVRTLAGPVDGDLDGPIDPVVNIGWAESRDDHAAGAGRVSANAFRRRWGTVILETALAGLRSRAVESGDPDRVERLLPYLARRVPNWRSTDIGAAVDSSDVDDLRDEFRSEVRRAVSETVTTPARLEAELVDLFG